MKKQNEKKPTKRDLNNQVPYTDFHLIFRMKEYKNHLSEYFKTQNARKGYFFYFLPFVGVFKLLLAGIKLSATNIMRFGAGAWSRGGLITTFLTFGVMTILNRPYTWEEVQTFSTAIFDFWWSVFDPDVSIDVEAIFLATFKAESILFAGYSVLCLVLSLGQILTGWMKKYTDEEEKFEGYNFVYLILRKYAPLSNRYCILTIEPALLTLLGFGFLQLGEIMPAVWFFASATILLFSEFDRSLFRATIPA